MASTVNSTRFIRKPVNMAWMFWGRRDFRELDLSEFDSSNTTNMERMFGGCRYLKSLNLSHFDTSKVTNMYWMFAWCRELTSLDLSRFDTAKVTNMYEMFHGCEMLTHIKCTAAFRDWCWKNASTIFLPDAMLEGGSGTWELVA